jgi:hypothetical protein
MTNDLDTRARAGARAAHDAVRDLPIPSVAPARGPHRARLVLVAAAAIVVVALTATLLGGGDDDARVSTDPTGAAPRLVADPPPAGMVVGGATELPGGDPFGSGTYWVYGDAGRDAPFEADDLAVVEVALDESAIRPDDARSTEVAGHPAWVSPPSEDASGSAQHSVYVELDGSTVGLISASLDDDELLAVAGELDLDADGLEPPASIAGLDQIGTVTGAIDLSTMLPFPIGAGHQVGYSDVSRDGSEGIAVASLEGGDDLLAVARWSLGASAHSVEVRGFDGWLGSSSGTDTPLLVWQESPTAVIAVVGYGVDDAALLATAESLRVADDDEWATLLAQAGSVEVPGDAQVGVSGGGQPDSAFAAYLDADGSLCVSYADGDGSAEMCSGGDLVPLTVSTQRLASGEILLFGYTTLGTDGEVRIEGDDGSAVGSEAYHDEGTLFAGVFSDAELPAEVIVRTSGGAELERMAVGVPGEGSVSFSGQGTPITEP